MPLPLAVALAHARLVGEPVDDAATEPPASAAEAYAVAEQVAELLPTEPVGWKIGATSAAAQERLAVRAPIAGRVFERTLLEAGSSVEASDFHQRPGIECELAFRTRSPLPSGDQPMDAPAARELVGTVHPAIELVGSRYVAGLAVAPALLVADGSAHSALVIGDGVAPDRAGDLREARCTLIVDGTERTSGLGSEVLGDPYAALAWLCNHLRGRGLDLPSGSVVTTGTCTGIVPSEPDQTITNDAGPLGSVTIHLRG